MRRVRHGVGEVVVALWCVVGGAGAAQGQALFRATGFPETHDLQSVFPYEHVDPLTGNLVLAVTDLRLPGNAGLDLTVRRIYNSKIHPRFEAGDYTLAERSWVGVGWRLHFGRVLNSGGAIAPGKTVIELGDGSTHPLLTTPAFPEGWMTAEFWRYDRTTHQLKLPNGTVYTFGHVAAPNGLLTDARYVTRIEDAYGNSLVFTYFAAPGPTDGVASITQDLGGGQSRVVTFTYDPATRLLQTMAYDGRTWTYAYAPSNVAGHAWLVDVRAPGQVTRWGYAYDGTLLGGELKELVAPTGGVITFTYATGTRPLNQLSVPTRGVTRRVLTAAGTVLATYGFAYAQGPQQNETVVTTPCNVLRYRYGGIGQAAPFNAWASGLLQVRQLETLQGQVLETETLTWQTLPAISADPVPGTPGGTVGDPATYPAVVTARTVTREGQTWRTTFVYRQDRGAFSDYGRPATVRTYTRANALARETSTTYEYGFLGQPGLPYVLPVQSVVETQGAESATTSYTYDLWTGFPLTMTSRGVTTTYTRTSRGNVASVKDALRPPTTFEHSWGAMSVMAPPVGPIVTRNIRPDGLVAWERVGPAAGGLTTTYGYDEGGRVTQVTPSGGGGSARWPTFTSYDVARNRWVRTVQGDLTQPSTQRVSETTFDYFGRPIGSTDAAGVQLAVEYDACGRVAKESLPYSGSTFRGWGTTVTYDGLGRPLSQTRRTSPTTTSTTSWSYGVDQETIRDGLSRATTYTYTSDGDPSARRLVRVTDADGKETTYAYTLAGEVREVRGPGTGPTPSGPVRTWTYDATSGRLLADTQPESGTTQYTYDVTGLLQTVTLGAGTAQAVTTTLQYDAGGRPTGRDLPGTSDDVTYTYDTLGRVVRQTTGGVTTDWGFDAATGRTLRRTDTVDGRAFTSTYAYSAYDDLIQVGYPRVGGAGRVVTYGVTPTSGRLTSVSTTANGATVPFAHALVYDAAGRLTQYQTGAVTHTVSYDDASRPTAIGVGLPGAAAAQRLDLAYTYNAASEVTRIADPRPGTEQTFSYDALSRLRDAAGPYGTLVWAYDATGNRTQTLRNGAATQYGYDASQRLTSLSGAVSETMSYDALGRLTADSQGTYAYRPGGTVGSVTRAAPALSATFQYATDGWRIARTVNGQTSYTLRGLASQALSTFDVQCGTPVWTRDYIYGAGTTLGSIRRGPTTVTVSLGAAAQTVGEGGAATLGVRLTTTDGSTLACPVSVAYHTTNGTAVAGQDYTATAGTLTFPAGSGGAAGTTLPITVPMLADALDEPEESFTVGLSAPSGGAVLGALSTATVTIVDDDPPPSVGIACGSATEGYVATCTLTLSAPSAFPITVWVSTIDGTALASANDYQPRVNVPVTWAPGQAGAQTVAIQSLDDLVAEPTETLSVRLSVPPGQPVSVAGDGQSLVSLVDNDGTYQPINLGLGGWFLADLDASQPDYVLIANPTGPATTARVTVIRPNGVGSVREVAVAAGSRVGLPLGDEPGVSGPVSVAVQSLDGVSLDVEHAQYANGFATGRATEGVTPAATWYFAEGSLAGSFNERLTVFNVSNGPAEILVRAILPDGQSQDRTYLIQAGPGRVSLSLRDWGTLPAGDVSLFVLGRRPDTGAEVPIVAERVMTWGDATTDQTSTPGVSQPATAWHFADGNKTVFDEYIAVLNPQAATQTLSVAYRHANGQVYTGALSVGPYSRATFTLPAWLPDGDVAVSVSAPLPFVAERAVYGGTNWTVGTAGVGSPVGATTWTFAEGATHYFDCYFSFVNLSGQATWVTLTFTTVQGATYSTTQWVGAGVRGTVLANQVPGLNFAEFRTTITAGAPIVAERALYWWRTTPQQATRAARAPEAPADAGDALRREDDVRPAGWALRGNGPPPSSWLTSLVPVVPTGPVSVARARGEVSAEEAVALREAPAMRAGLAGPVLTPTAAGLLPPWQAGHVALGRRR